MRTDSKTYSGEFLETVKSHILRNYADGEKYIGEFVDGNMTGVGARQYVDGAHYVGEWKDGNMHGQGTETHPDGTTYIGGFKYGVPVP